jgi:predicted ABC-type ATPase
MKKEIWIVTGPNGAGKSTLVEKYNKDNLPIVNPDIIAVGLNEPSEQRKHLIAGRQALTQRRDLFGKGSEFIVETTFSGKGGLNLIKEAKARGYRVNLAFVGLVKPSLSQVRVSSRVQRGGHAVPTADVFRRFDRVYENVKTALPLCDRAFIVDNSRRAPLLVAKLKRGKMVRKYPTLDKWLKERFPSLKQSRSKSLGL